MDAYGGSVMSAEIDKDDFIRLIGRLEHTQDEESARGDHDDDEATLDRLIAMARDLRVAALDMNEVPEDVDNHAVESVRDALMAAYIAGCHDVHKAWSPSDHPEFTEAGYDYIATIDVPRVLASLQAPCPVKAGELREKVKTFLRAAISAYHTTRLADAHAVDHILTKHMVQTALDDLLADSQTSGGG